MRFFVLQNLGAQGKIRIDILRSLNGELAFWGKGLIGSSVLRTEYEN